MPTLIGSKQLAQQLGISLRTLDSLDKNGDLPKSLRIGHLRRWREEDVEQWIDSKLNSSGNSEQSRTMVRTESKNDH